jgi:hypothetical protein
MIPLDAVLRGGIVGVLLGFVVLAFRSDEWWWVGFLLIQAVICVAIDYGLLKPRSVLHRLFRRN